MLIQFSVKNYRSFKDEQVLNMVASKDDSLPRNVNEVGNLRILRSAAIYGPNASGKSNLVNALAHLSYMVVNSTDTKPGQDIPYEPFLFSEGTRNAPCEFEVVFEHKGVRYQYGFSSTKNMIVEEWLYAWPEGRKQIWFERSGRDHDISCGNKLLGTKADLIEKTRPEVLFLTVGAEWNNEQLKTVHEWFHLMLRFLPSHHSYFTGPITASMLDVDDSGNLHSQIQRFLRMADFGINDFVIRKKNINESQSISYLPEEVRSKLLESDAKFFDISFSHRIKDTDSHASLAFEDESEGTRRFFDLLGPWLAVMKEGFVLAIDEIEASLHSLLTHKLLDLFLNSEEAKPESQLIFATHDTTLLDPSMFRRDQIWFTEKNEEGATELYSMYDYKERKPRKGEAMQKAYLAGRYGAIPILEAFDTEL